MDNYANTVNTSIVYSANYDTLSAFPAGDVGRIILDLYALNNLENYLDVDLKTSINAFLNNRFDNMCGSFSSLTLRDLLYDRVHLQNKIFNQFTVISSLSCKQCMSQLPSPISMLESDCEQEKGYT